MGTPDQKFADCVSIVVIFGAYPIQNFSTHVAHVLLLHGVESRSEEL